MSLVELDPAVPVLGHWMSLILAAGKEVRVTFKAHYMTKDAAIIAQNTFGSSRLSEKQAKNFLKEFCNLTIGTVKDFLALNQVVVGTSLPIICRGFDDLFFPPPAGESFLIDRWRLQTPEAKVECSVTYEFFSDFEINQLTAIDEAAVGDVEFL